MREKKNERKKTPYRSVSSKSSIQFCDIAFKFLLSLLFRKCCRCSLAARFNYDSACSFAQMVFQVVFMLSHEFEPTNHQRERKKKPPPLPGGFSSSPIPLASNMFVESKIKKKPETKLMCVCVSVHSYHLINYVANTHFHSNRTGKKWPRI